MAKATARLQPGQARLMSQTLTDKDVAQLCRGGSVVLHTGQKRVLVINADSNILKWLNHKLKNGDKLITPTERRKILEMM
jgi:hypothetical protein